MGPKKRTEETVEISDSSSDNESLPIAERIRRLRKKKADTTLAAGVIEQDLEHLEELQREEEAKEAARLQREKEAAAAKRDREEAGPSRRRKRTIEVSDDESVAERVQRRRKTDTGKEKHLYDTSNGHI